MRFIYRITNKLNGKHYVGQTKDLEKRWKTHVQSAESGFGHLLHSAIRKYGSTNFEFVLIENCEDNLANELEKKWILHYESFGKGYNLTTGGDCEFERSEITIQKMSESKKGHEVSEETKEKIGKANRGRIRTKKVREKLSLSLKGHEVSEETREKIRKGHLNKVISEETRKKISEAKSGKKQDLEVVKRRAEKLKGKKCSEETRKKIGAANSGRIQTEERKQKTRDAWARWRLKKEQEKIPEEELPPQES
jgi:group I intron endonuclease